jgi:hypothetical protein
VPDPRTARPPLRPDRLRRIGGQSFAFLPHRFLRDGFLQSLLADELRLYLFLLLAADRDGISFYSHQRLCTTLQLSAEAYLAARDGLRHKDLVATDGVRVQVLSLPPAPAVPLAPPASREDQVSACQAIIASLSTHAPK